MIAAGALVVASIVRQVASAASTATCQQVSDEMGTLREAFLDDRPGLPAYTSRTLTRRGCPRHGGFLVPKPHYRPRSRDQTDEATGYHKNTWNLHRLIAGSSRRRIQARVASEINHRNTTQEMNHHVARVGHAHHRKEANNPRSRRWPPTPEEPSSAFRWSVAACTTSTLSASTSRTTSSQARWAGSG